MEVSNRSAADDDGTSVSANRSKDGRVKQAGMPPTTDDALPRRTMLRHAARTALTALLAAWGHGRRSTDGIAPVVFHVAATTLTDAPGIALVVSGRAASADGAGAPFRRQDFGIVGVFDVD